MTIGLGYAQISTIDEEYPHVSCHICDNVGSRERQEDIIIDKLNNNQIPEETLNTRRSVSGVIHNVKFTASSQGNTQDTFLQISFDSIIQQTKQAPTPDGSAVARGKELIASGQLDTPKNIREAAQNMLKFGI
jgi:hypothetical protein